MHVTELYGLVWVSLDAPVADIPVMACDGDARFRRINTPVEVWRASATRMTDNFMDICTYHGCTPGPSVVRRTRMSLR